MLFQCRLEFSVFLFLCVQCEFLSSRSSHLSRRLPLSGVFQFRGGKKLTPKSWILPEYYTIISHIFPLGSDSQSMTTGLPWGMNCDQWQTGYHHSFPWGMNFELATKGSSNPTTALEGVDRVANQHRNCAHLRRPALAKERPNPELLGDVPLVH